MTDRRKEGMNLQEGDPIMVQDGPRIFKQYKDNGNQIEFYTVENGTLSTKKVTAGAVREATYSELTIEQQGIIENIRDYLKLRRKRQ